MATKPKRRRGSSSPTAHFSEAPDLTALDFLLGIMRDARQPDQVRMGYAMASLPYCHTQHVLHHAGGPDAGLPGSASRGTVH